MLRARELHAAGMTDHEVACAVGRGVSSVRRHIAKKPE
jgi:hypothetical protein